jgi:hypothetical protein
MSQNKLTGMWDRLGLARVPTPVSVPIGIEFFATDCVWNIRKNRFVHVARPETDLIPVGIGWPDAWNVRAEFLAARSPEQFLAVLNANGVFSSEHESFTLADLQVIQKGLRHMLSVDHQHFREAIFGDHLTKVLFHSRFSVGFAWRHRPTIAHAGIITVRRTLGAMLATVYLDKLRDAKFGFCARQDCRRQFEITSQHKRKYCTPACAHMETVRRGRQRAGRGD